MNRLLVAIALIAIFNCSAFAGIIVTSGSDSVKKVDRKATFDEFLDLSNFELWNYQEDKLLISSDDLSGNGFDPTKGNGGFDGGFYYPRGGFFGFTYIRTTDDLPFTALQLNLGTGYKGTNIFVHYEIWTDNTAIAVGALQLSTGSLLGFLSDGAGFDELRIGVYQNMDQATNATVDSYQAIALDNVKAELFSPSGEPDPPSIVPEPASLSIMLVGIVGLLSRRVKRVC